MLATVPGVGPAVAVGAAFGLTVLGVLVDLMRVGTASTVFQVCYVLGCVLAVAWIRRRDVFTAMVQPPLLLLVALPVVLLLSSDPRPGQGITERLLVTGAPLVNAFPTMALATALSVAGGVARMVWQRQGWESDRPRDTGPDDAGEPSASSLHRARPPDLSDPPAEPVSGRPEPGEAPGEARRPGFPRRS